MKFKGMLALFAAAPLALLCGCGGTVTNLSFHANWYKNTSLKDNLAGTEETLVYDVTFEGTDQKLSMKYEEGVFKTTLKNGQVQTDSSSQEGYIYSADLTVKVRFSLNGVEGELYEDTIHSEVQFLSAARGLKPVRSVKNVHCHSPLTSNPSSLENAVAEYDFTYDVDYNDALTEAAVTYTDRLYAENSETKTYSLKGEGSFLDNEQILFALRGIDLSYAQSFRSLNPVMEKEQQVSLTVLEQKTAAVDFVADGENIKLDELPVSSVTLRYSNIGEPQTLVYAKTTDYSSNLYRNVLLEMKIPVYYSLGTITYKLKTATFAAK